MLAGGLALALSGGCGGAVGGLLSRLVPEASSAGKQAGFWQEKSPRAGFVGGAIGGAISGTVLGAMFGAGVVLEAIHGADWPYLFAHWGAILGAFGGALIGLIVVCRAIFGALPSPMQARVRSELTGFPAPRAVHAAPGRGTACQGLAAQR
jgi:hypothetical protein